MADRDPYKREQQRLIQLYDDITSDEENSDAAYEGEFSSDENYVPSESSASQSDESEDSDLNELPELSNVETSNNTLHNPQQYNLPEESEVEEPDALDQDSQKIIQKSQDSIPLQALQNQNSDSSDDIDTEWEFTTADIPDFNFDESTNRLKINLNAEDSPKDVFEYLFTDDIMSYLVECTNNYGEDLTRSNRPKTRNARDNSFRPVTIDEMKKFLALCLLQGQITTSNMRRLFSYGDVLYFHPIFSYIMSGRRFEKILRTLNCSSRTAKHKEKIQAFLDMLIAKFHNAYGPSKELSLDESLLHFRGRLGFRVYLKNKKARYGIKFYELTTSDGYLLNTEMYSGDIQNASDVGTTKVEAIVMRLMKPYLMKGHELFMDNFYNSSILSEKLLSLKTHTNGTLRSNRRNNPKELIKKKLKKGEHFWMRKKNVYVSKWRDKRDVLVITTRNHPRLIQVKNRYGHEKIKPEEVDVYNRHMSGIDRCDQMTSTYSTPRKTIRWYKKVIFHLLDVTVWNSFYLYRKYCKNNSKTYRYLEFRDSLIKSYLKLPPGLEAKNLVRREKHDNRLPENSNYEPECFTNETNLANHWPERNPGIPSAKSNKKKVFLKCRLCAKKGQRKESGYRCKGCPQKPPLCPDCFEEWHEITKNQE